MKKRSQLPVIAMIVLTLVFLAACSNSSTNNALGGNQDNQASQTNQEKKDNQETVTIKFFSALDLYNKGQFGYNEIQEFMKENPNIKVDISTARWGKPWDDTFIALATSNELPDVFQPTWTFNVSTLNSKGWIRPLDGIVSNDFKDKFPKNSMVEGVTMLNGKVYSFPRMISKMGFTLICNQDVMKSAGLDPNKLPETWDDLFEMSKTVTEKLPGVYGLALPLKVSKGYNSVLAMLGESQPTMDPLSGFDYRKGRYDFDSPNVVNAIEFLLKMKKAGLIHPNSPTFDTPDMLGQIANNKVAFAIQGSVAVRQLHASFPQFQNYSIAPMPVPKKGLKPLQLSATTTADTFVSATTKHPKEVGKLIDFLSSKDFYINQMNQDLLLPPNPESIKDRSVIKNTQLRQMADYFDKSMIGRPYPESVPGVSQVIALEDSLPAPKPSWWELIQGIYLDKVPNWKEELTKVNNAYNTRLDDAIKKGKEQGLNVSRDNFTFTGFDGTKDYQ